jgi:hypothetical protein
MNNTTVPIELTDLATLLATAKVVRKALVESGASPDALDQCVDNIAKTIMNADMAASAATVTMFSDN